MHSKNPFPEDDGGCYSREKVISTEAQRAPELRSEQATLTHTAAPQQAGSAGAPCDPAAALIPTWETQPRLGSFREGAEPSETGLLAGHCTGCFPALHENQLRENTPSTDPFPPIFISVCLFQRFSKSLFLALSKHSISSAGPNGE